MRVPHKLTAISEDDSGGKNIVPFASVIAKDELGNNADIYFVQTGGSPSSSFNLDAFGEKQIWAEPGTYQFSVNGGPYYFEYLSSYSAEDFSTAEKAKLADAVTLSGNETITGDKLNQGVTTNEGAVINKNNVLNENTVDFQDNLIVDSKTEGRWRGFVDDSGNIILGFDRHTGLARLYADQETIDLIYNYQPSVYAPERLRNISQMLSSVNNGATARPVWVAIGDSWTQAYRHYIEETIARLGNEYGFTGHGWVQLGSTSGLTTDYTITRDGTWTVDSRDERSPSLQSATSSTAGGLITIVGFGGETDAVLYGYSGSFRYRFNGGSWTSDSFTGGALETKILSGVPNLWGTSWTCDIEVVSGTLTVFGLDIFNDSISGIRVSNIGMAGSYTSEWVAIDEDDFVDGLTGLNGDLHTIMHGTNDQWLSGAANITPSQYRDNLIILVNRIRSARPNSDILLISPPQVRNDGPPTREYRDAMRSVAIEYNCAHLDLMPYFGDAFEDYEYGSGRALLDNTLIHPAQSGGDVIVDAILKCMLGASFPKRS